MSDKELKELIKIFGMTDEEVEELRKEVELEMELQEYEFSENIKENFKPLNFKRIDEE